MLFKDIPGKEKEKAELIKSVHEDKIAHAQLFLGRPGTGQLALALAYGTYIQCKDRQPDDACGKCSSCLKNAKYAHPDFHFTFPVIKKDGLKREETTSNDFLNEWRSALEQNPYMSMEYWTRHIDASTSPDINKRECSTIVKKLALKSYESPYKVILIWMPEYLRKEGNRLLKIIEEPTDKTVIILVAEEAHQILGTILSRTQLTKVRPFSKPEIEAYISEKYGITQDIASDIARFSDGNISSAIVRSQGNNIDYSVQFMEWMRQCYKLDPIELSKSVGTVAALGKEAHKHFLAYGIMFLEQYIRSLYLPSDMIQLEKDEAESMAKISKLLTEDVASSIVNLLDTSIGRIGRNVNTKLMMMNVSIEVGRMLRSQKHSHPLFE